MTSWFGKYRGKVESNLDPMQQGRLQVSCPAVLGDGRMSWAMPCVPFAGAGVGLFLIPPTGANVWVEFEGGDPDYPIWSGCFWGVGEVPAAPAIEQMKVLKTDGISLTLSDVPGAGGVTLEVSPPAVATPLKVVLDSTGITIEASPSSVKVALSGIDLANGAASVKLTPASVSINNGALEVI
jgi:hypothetical protein